MGDDAMPYVAGLGEAMEEEERREGGFWRSLETFDDDWRVGLSGY